MTILQRQVCSECGEDLGFSESNPCGLCELKALNDPLDEVEHQRLKDAVIEAAKAWRKAVTEMHAECSVGSTAVERHLKSTEAAHLKLYGTIDVLLQFEQQEV